MTFDLDAESEDLRKKFGILFGAWLVDVQFRLNHCDHTGWVVILEINRVEDKLSVFREARGSSAREAVATMAMRVNNELSQRLNLIREVTPS